jgi:hypothetical protein
MDDQDKISNTEVDDLLSVRHTKNLLVLKQLYFGTCFGLVIAFFVWSN